MGYKKNVVKSKSYLPMVPEEGAWSTLTIIDKQRYQQRRRVISRALSDSALRAFEPAMLEHMDIFLEQLRGPVDANGWSSPRDMSALCKFFVFEKVTLEADEFLGMRLTLDILFEYAFGQKLCFQVDRSQDYLPRIIKLYLWKMGL